MNLPALLGSTARVLRAVPDLPPVATSLDTSPSYLAPVVICPDPRVDANAGRALVHAMAAALHWPARELTSGWRTGGRVNGVEVDVIAVPPLLDQPVVPRLKGSTAAHAALLRDLTDWAASLGQGARILEVSESEKKGRGFSVHLVVEEHVLPRLLTDHAIVLAPNASAGSGYRASGLTPTGHELHIAVPV